MAKSKRPAPLGSHTRRGEGVRKKRSSGLQFPKGTPIDDVMKEVFKASPALDVADKILRGFQRVHRPEDESSLADQFVASTYTMAKDLKLRGKDAKEWEIVMQEYRDTMRHAHRFTLDNEFCRMATEISSRTLPEKLLYRLQFATLPYEVTWIEFDLHVKVRKMREMHNADPEGVNWKDISPRMGLLFHRISDTAALMELIGNWGGDDPMVAPNLLCYFFSTKEEMFRRHAGCIPIPNQSQTFAIPENVTPEEFAAMRRTTDSLVGGAMWGYGDVSGTNLGIVETTRDLLAIHTPEFLAKHGAIGLGKIFWSIRRTLKSDASREDKLRRNSTFELAEYAGMTRWAITVLAMLNEVPVRSELVVQSHQLRAGITKRIKAVDYHRLTLRLPKTKPIPFIERHLSNVERRHKAHEVRAFWRTYLHDVHCKPEEHKWLYDYDNGYRLCERCEAYSRYIHEHVRGDPTLGWVRKDYMIKPTKQE
jgi:hypothetical protein